MAERRQSGGRRRSDRDGAYRTLPEAKILEIVERHEKWLDGGRQGSGRANLTRADLRRVTLKGRRLTGAVLRETDLRGRDLSATELSEVDFTGADLHGASFRGADLMHADFTDAEGLSGDQLGGANLAGARLPAGSGIVEESLSQVREAASQAERTVHWTILITASALVVSLASSPDLLFRPSTTVSIPGLSLPVPIKWFYALTPILLTGLYVSQMAALDRFWHALATLPRVLPNHRRLSGRLVHAYPNFCALVSRPVEHSDGTVSAPTLPQRWLVTALVWWVVPIVLLILWVVYLDRHDPGVTVFQLMAFAAALWAGVRSYDTVRGILRSAYLLSDVEPGRWVVWVRRAVFAAPAALSAVSVLSITAEGSAWLCPPSERATVCNQLAARLGHARLDSITGEGQNLRRAYLASASLRRASLEDAFLTNANLAESKLSRAYLKGADLRGAVLWGAALDSATLRYSDLRGADLRGADLRRARLQGAKLAGARLEETSLDSAIVCGSGLHLGNLSSFGLDSSSVRGAVGLDRRQLVYDSIKVLRQSGVLDEREWREYLGWRLAWERIRQPLPMQAATGRDGSVEAAALLRFLDRIPLGMSPGTHTQRENLMRKVRRTPRLQGDSARISFGSIREDFSSLRARIKTKAAAHCVDVDAPPLAAPPASAGRRPAQVARTEPRPRASSSRP